MKFRKKPIIIEAVQFLPTNPRDYYPMVKEDPQYLKQFYIETNSGDAYLFYGDWIITEMDGKNYYPCEKKIFEKTYEPVSELEN